MDNSYFPNEGNEQINKSKEESGKVNTNRNDKDEKDTIPKVETTVNLPEKKTILKVATTVNLLDPSRCKAGNLRGKTQGKIFSVEEKEKGNEHEK